LVEVAEMRKRSGACIQQRQDKAATARAGWSIEEAYRMHLTHIDRL